MGNNSILGPESKEEGSEKFKEKHLFVMETQSPYFGRFKVYKMLEKPYEYIMCKTYLTMPGTVFLENKKQRYSKIPKNKSIIGFDYVNIDLIEQKCGKHVELNAFCRYYYFTLQECILKRVKKQQKFPEDEVLYLAKTLVSLYQVFHQNSAEQCKLFRTQNIFLSPQGFLKVYPFLNQWKQENLQEGDSQSNSFFSIATGTEVSLKLSQRDKSFDFQQINSTDDMLDIGIILLSAINTTKESDYRTEKGEIRMDIINFILNSYSDPDNKSLFLFKKILKGIFFNKWTTRQLKEELQKLEDNNLVKISTRIKIISNQSEDNDQTTNSDNIDKQREEKLKTMPKNFLIPGKINCMSARKSGLKL